VLVTAGLGVLVPVSPDAICLETGAVGNGAGKRMAEYMQVR